MQTLAYGYPKLGEERQFKRELEAFFSGSLKLEELLESLSYLERERLDTYLRYVENFPAGELSLYDPMVDLAYSLDLIPERFLPYEGLKTYFEMARGKMALEMTKWFNTNYHYLVPEVGEARFTPRLDLLSLYWKWSQGKTSLFSLVGPFTFLKMAKKVIPTRGGGFTVRPFTTEELTAVLEALAEPYAQILKGLCSLGVRSFLLHEPALCLDISEREWEAISSIYAYLAAENIKVLLLTYYDSVGDLSRILKLPVSGIGLDLLSNRENGKNLRTLTFPSDKTLILGVVSGRSVFRTPLKQTLSEIEDLLRGLHHPEVYLSNAQPLYHLPLTVEVERKLPLGLKEHLAFAQERLQELMTLAKAYKGDSDAIEFVEADAKRRQKPYAENPEVRKKLAEVSEDSFQRSLPYAERIRLQHERLKLPLLPTTTIGSFPQTEEIRRMRSAYRKGEISAIKYQEFVKEKIRKLIQFQEEIGLDVLVHGEFERTDMVEYFAERLEGVAVTEHGWVLSYGSRVYRPPIIYGDVWRPEPMTVAEIKFAQGLTEKPVKGMLTGPVTILNWSYSREDIPRSQVAFMLALAIQEEVKDLEEEGIRIIQIDEPAFREGAPLKKKDWPEYFRWAAQAFRLASRAKPETQIHTHMCYSEFSEILLEIQSMDFDVISIEASRSKGELVEAFARHPGWERELGIGVYDIHSPTIPTEEEISVILRRVLEVFPPHLVWVNPDCGLKTRRWEEVTPALKNMVAAARRLREDLGERTRLST